MSADFDVVDLLLDQHLRIEQLFAGVLAARGDERQRAFDDLARLLMAHEAAEQEVVHPIAREVMSGGEAIIDDRFDEELQIRATLAVLAETDPDEQAFTAALLVLRDTVLTHARREERDEFPHLRANLSSTRLQALADAVRAAEQVAPEGESGRVSYGQ